MKKILLLIFILSFHFSHAQLEPVNDITVGSELDFTMQPYIPTTKFSRTQTIYYADRMEFNGQITGIRFFTEFSNPTTSPAPNTDFILRIGHTSKEEFIPYEPFIADSQLTQIGISTYHANANEWILIFDQPFNYNGIDNLVIDVEDINPEESDDGLYGFVGVENFNNPPTRSRVSVTNEFDDGSTETDILYQNSYAKIRFDGNLQICTNVTISDIENITDTGADFTINENSIANHYRYVVSELGEDIPDTYQTTTQEQITITGLQPATNYLMHVKSDCDAFGVNSGYSNYHFRTRPNLVTVPHIIDFEGSSNDDYSIAYGGEINAEAANNSMYGLMFNGLGYPDYLSWDDNLDPFENSSLFLRVFSMDVDLTQNTINPILRFDVSQTSGSYLRVKIKPYADDSIITGVAEDFTYHASNNENDFKTVSIDLSQHTGEKVTIKLEHISRTTSKKTYLDNIKIEENNCPKINNIDTSGTTNSISISWDATSENVYELAIAEFGDYVDAAYTTVNTNSYTFNDLDIATSYQIYMRNKCTSADSPWQTIYASTNPNYLPVGYDEYFFDNALTNDYFSVLDSPSSKLEDITYYLSETFTMHQRNSKSEWVGGFTTTESQAWNENMAFMSGLKFIIDGTSISSGSVDLTFKLYHYAGGVSEHSWFRILINGTQYGSSYNPVTKNSDPETDVSIDLTPYIGDQIEIELQQVGRHKDDFSFGAMSGDGTALFNINYNATTLSNKQVELDKMQIFPNPTNNFLNIKGMKGSEIMTIYNMNGKIIESIKKNSGVQSNQIDVQDLSTGIYFLKIQSGNKKQIIKFIKE